MDTRYEVLGATYASEEEALAVAQEFPSDNPPVTPVQFERVWDVVTEAGAQVVVGVDEETAKAEQERLKNDIDGDPSVVFTLATREVQVD